MIRIAVCDDVREVVMQINDYLYEYQEQKNEKLNINNFYDAENLWDFLKTNHCDLIILDIELVNMNGIELGMRIRTELNDQDIKIIVISAMENYYKQLFDIQPLNFLLKPIDKTKFFQVIDLAIRLVEKKDHIFVFKIKESTYRLKVKDILYFESFKHNIKIVTTNGAYEYRSGFSQVMEQLSGFGFIKVHRSYVINYDQTKNIDYDRVIMSNSVEIPISRDRRKETRETFLKLGESR